MVCEDIRQGKLVVIWYYNNVMDFQLTSTSSDDEFSPAAVAYLTEKITAAIHDHGICTLGLSGGSTPGPIYEALAEQEEIDWSKVSIFLVDERHVDRKKKESNQKLITDTLLKHIDIPRTNLYFPETTLPIDECVEHYALRLVGLFQELSLIHI